MISRSEGTRSKLRTTSPTVASSLNTGTMTESLGSYWVSELKCQHESVAGDQTHSRHNKLSRLRSVLRQGISSATVAKKKKGVAADIHRKQRLLSFRMRLLAGRSGGRSG